MSKERRVDQEIAHLHSIFELLGNSWQIVRHTLALVRLKPHSAKECRRERSQHSTALAPVASVHLVKVQV
jgi:hypothetical protein